MRLPPSLPLLPFDARETLPGGPRPCQKVPGGNFPEQNRAEKRRQSALTFGFSCIQGGDVPLRGPNTRVEPSQMFPQTRGNFPPACTRTFPSVKGPERIQWDG